MIETVHQRSVWSFFENPEEAQPLEKPNGNRPRLMIPSIRRAAISHSSMVIRDYSSKAIHAGVPSKEIREKYASLHVNNAGEPFPLSGMGCLSQIHLDKEFQSEAVIQQHLQLICRMYLLDSELRVIPEPIVRVCEEDSTYTFEMDFGYNEPVEVMIQLIAKDYFNFLPEKKLGLILCCDESTTQIDQHRGVMEKLIPGGNVMCPYPLSSRYKDAKPNGGGPISQKTKKNNWEKAYDQQGFQYLDHINNEDYTLLRKK